MESLSELELRRFLARLLCGDAEEDDERMLAADPALAEEVERRLQACGATINRARGRAPICVIETDASGLSELALAALALCAIALRPGQGEQERRPRITVDDLAARMEGSHSSAYIRRAALGPLEKRGLVRVVKPEQRAEGAYVVAGPAFAAVDGEGLLERLRSLRDAA